MKISFEKKLNLFFLVICSAIITVGIISYFRNKSAVAADKWVKHTTYVIEILDKLLLSNIDIVTYTKEYLVHYDSISIPLLENSKKSAQINLTNLTSFTLDNARQQLRIDSLKYLQEKQITFSDRNIMQRKGNDFVTGVEMSAMFQEMNQIEDIRNLIERIEETENKLLKERKDAYNKSIEDFNTSIYIFYSSIFALLIIVFYIIRYNIKKRKEIQEDLEQSLMVISTYKNELENQSLAISRSNAIAEFDLTGNLLTANSNFLNLFGYSLVELKGRNHSILLTKDQVILNKSPQFWATLNEGNFHLGEFERKRKDDESVWIQGSYNPIFNSDGKLVKVMEIVTDITEQINSFKEITDYKTGIEHQSTAISRSNAIAEFDSDGNILKANTDFLSLFGYTIEEIRNKHHRILLAENNIGINRHENFWKQLEIAEVVISELEFRRKDGKSIWIQASYNPKYDVSGKLFKVILIVY